MNHEVYVRDLLLMEFLGRQAKNPHYSMRAFSKNVGVPQSAISEIINRRRKITAKMAQKIMTGLCVPPEKISSLIEGYGGDPLTPIRSPQKFQSLSMDQFHLIADWYHFAILSLAETKNFKGDASWIAKRLGTTETQAADATSRLLRLKMLEMDPQSKKIRATGVQYQIDPGVATAALKKVCRVNLELSADALDSTQYSERDFTAITLCFDPDKMAEAKRMIQSFRAKFSQQMESGKKSEVYKLCIQLFPLTKNRNAP